MLCRNQLSLDMSDSELKHWSSRNRLEYGLSPWAHFSTERTSFGRSIRRRAFYPPFLPLMFIGDHYVDFQSGLRENEIFKAGSSSFEINYISWNRDKVELLKKEGMNAVHVPHPWVTDTKLQSRLSHEGTKRGSIFFFPHSGPNFEIELDLQMLKKRLLELPLYFRPISICLSSHDIDLDKHKRLRELSFPITTAGDLCSKYFADRFYTLINQVKFTLSAGPLPGSEVYYCILAGKTHRILSDLPVGGRRLNRDTGSEETWVINHEEYPDVQKYKFALEVFDKLRLNHVEDDPVVEHFVREYMGLSAAISRYRFTIFVWLNLFKNWKSVFILYKEFIPYLFKNWKLLFFHYKRFIP